MNDSIAHLASSDRPLTRLASMTNRIQEARNMVMDCASQARRAADSIIGEDAVERTDANGKAQAATPIAQGGELGRLDIALEDLHASFQDLFYQTSRLEKSGVAY